MKRQRQAIRDTDAGDSLEILLVTAITTILGLRAYLKIAHYPQVGGGTLHVAHMLWGGLLMMVALAILLIYWNPAIRRSAAVVAGIGWGMFIDELGKFITKDDNYLFQPTIALLYVVFVMMFIVFRAMTRQRSFSVRELEVNREMRIRLHTADDAPGIGGDIGHWVLSIRGRVDEGYARLAIRPWFERLLIGVFLAVSLTDLGRTIWYVVNRASRGRDLSRYEIFTTLLANACVWIGVAYLRRSRLRAMDWFQRSLMVIMFLATPLHFYQKQLAAFGGFLGILAIYIMLRYAIRREEGPV